MSAADADNDARRRRAPVPLPEPGSNELSPIERVILQLLRLGSTTKEIAAKLRISERTVKLHVCHSLQVIDARNRKELLARVEIRH
jgi:DNA-binding NarL/FixJ family response regulator